MKTNACATCLGLTILLSTGIERTLAAPGDAQHRNWPQWRGPSANGLVVHGNPPLEWNETKNLKWKVPIPGKGHATPAIWENRIFVLTAVADTTTASPPAAPPPPAEPAPPSQTGGAEGRGRGGGGRGRAPTQPHAFTLLCLDRSTGKVVWEKIARKEIPHQGVQEANTFCSGSPITDGKYVIASFGSYGLYCYDMNGKLVWEKDLGKKNVTFGEGSSPALFGDVLVVVQDSNGGSSLTALDKASGRELWKKSRDEGSGWTTPYILEHGGKVQVIVNGSKAVRSYELHSGDLIWECSGLGSNPVPMIVSDQQAVYAMSGHRNGMAMAIALGKSGNLTDTEAVRWKMDRGTPYVPSPLLYDGLLFFCQRTSGMLTCVDAATGKPHYEQQRLEGLSGVYASPVGVQDRIYLAGQNGATVVLAKSPELKVLALNKLDDGFDASPVVVDRQLFLRGRSHLYCIAEN